MIINFTRCWVKRYFQFKKEIWTWGSIRWKSNSLSSVLFRIWRDFFHLCIVVVLSNFHLYISNFNGLSLLWWLVGYFLWFLCVLLFTKISSVCMPWCLDDLTKWTVLQYVFEHCEFFLSWCLHHVLLHIHTFWMNVCM